MIKHADKIAFVARILLATVFFYGGIPKLFDLARFEAVVDAYGIVPDPFVFAVALILPVLEVIAGIGLILKKSWSIFITAFLYFIFISVLSYGIAMGLDIDCGCFAETDPEHEAFHGLRAALIRDFIFMIPLAYLVWYHKTHHFFKKKERVK